MNADRARGTTDPAQRLLPQAPEPERGVLCAFLNEPATIGKLCLEKGVTGAHFQLPAHAMLFEALMSMQRAGQPCDILTMTPALRDAGILEDVGGAHYLTGLQILGALPIMAPRYIEILIEKYALREAIKVGTELVARAHDEQDDPRALIAETEAKVKGIADTMKTAGVRELLAARHFDRKNPPPEPPPVLMLGNVVIATPENLAVAQGKAKGGKSALVGAIIASTMAPTGDCLGFSSNNPHGYAVIHFDTEQSKYHHHLMLNRALRRAGREEPPEWLRSYYMKGLTVEQLLTALRCELERGKRECSGVLMCVLDGIADYCSDVNDPAMSFALVAELERLTIEYQTVFVLVLHENPGSEIGKTRGHLGSQLERKAETNLRLEKDAAGVTVVYSDRSRTAHIPKEQGPRFQYDAEAGMHVSVEAKATAKADEKRDRLQELAVEIFRDVPVGMGLNWTQLHERIEEIEGIKRSGARKRFDALRDYKVIRQSGEKYRLA